MLMSSSLPLNSIPGDTLKKSSRNWADQLHESLQKMFDALEKEVNEKGKASFIVPVQKCLFEFLCKVLVGADPSAYPEMAEKGWSMLNKWLVLQQLPTVKTGVIPQPLEEILLHSFPFPSLLVKSDYQKVYEFLKKEGMLLSFMLSFS